MLRRLRREAELHDRGCAARVTNQHVDRHVDHTAKRYGRMPIRALKALLRSLFKALIAAFMLSERTVLKRGLNALRTDGPTECNESRGFDSRPFPNPHLFSPPTCLPTPLVSVFFFQG